MPYTYLFLLDLPVVVSIILGL